MIVETESDLNTYVESAKEPKAKKDNVGSCFGKLVKEVDSSDEKTAGCCSKAAKDTTGSGDGFGDATTQAGGQDNEITAFSLPDVDLNAWVGEYLSPSCIP
jgi:hypothetical protein